MKHQRTIIIGDEYNIDVFSVLKDVLARQGATLIRENLGVVGSQEMSLWEVSIRNATLTIEAETYEGLSVSGPADLVEEVARAVAKQTAITKTRPAISNGRIE